VVVTRIVAGTAGGRRLEVPPGDRTRPTSDRAREALFGTLAALVHLDGARVLDLYAGSGALGIEAASRGAQHVTLVDAARDAVEVCRRNVAALGLADRVRVVAEKAERFAQRAPAAPWDLVLIDPPYELSDLGDVLAGVAPALSVHAVVVVERSSRTPEPTWPAGLVRFDRRAYGDTVMWFAEPAAHDVAGDD
jgi:16S rRNA (guanine966-N2)-methyltransferase